MKALTSIAVIGLALLFTGCSTNVSRFQMPGANLSQVRTLCIRPLDDERDTTDLRSLIEANLKQRGIQTAVDCEAVDIEEGGYILDVAADWEWDITWYLLELRVAIYEPRNNTLVAQAQSLQSSLVRQRNETVVERAMASLFGDNEKPYGERQYEFQREPKN